MAKYEDYAKKYATSEVDIIADQIDDAGTQQVERETSTPEDDWEKRYKNLEVAYSRQGQQMGDYRKVIDDYVTTTPEEEPDSIKLTPITPDDIYENPDEAVRRAVDSHPAIKRVEELEAEIERTKAEAVMDTFNKKHPSFEETLRTPEFANWVHADATRSELAQRANGYDMAAADALFTMYESEAAPSPDASIDSIGLESGTGAEAPAPERYSRSDMLNQKIRSKQGDSTAEAYVKAHAAAYRNALVQGNVRD